MMTVGFHLSISGDICNAPMGAAASGYSALQLFVSSTRSWKSTKISGDAARRFKAASKGIALFAHIPYLCNPSSPNLDVRDKSKSMMLDNMKSCAILGVPHLVIHIGSHLGKGVQYGIGNTAQMVRSVIDTTEGVEILLENSAGYKNSVGSRFDEIGSILNAIDSKRAGVCLDTCHAFAAGNDMRSEEGVGAMADEIEEHIGIRRVKLIHLNDSKYDIKSGLDRHFHIGKGYIGMGGFENFFKNKAFRSGNFVMETPINNMGDNNTNMAAFSTIMQKVGLDAPIRRV